MYEYRTRVGFSNVGNDHRLKIYGLMNILQDTTCFHSDDIGYGLKWLSPKHMGWFVTNYEVHINEMPVYGQEILVRTYAVSFKGMLGNRNFEVLDLEGNTLAYASSLWILMDLDKQVPRRVPAEMVEAYEICEPIVVVN
ncbi:MAG: hypothetical protein HUK24_05980 [Sphaerochaetaceae bacterium]|nr:hypothetical protein [Sphaerochaetaceae bacterium]